MLLHVHEWGDPTAPPLVCLHGVSAHGRRFRRLAEEPFHAYRVLAPDLRGHGLSGYEPPWTFGTFVDDVLETVAAAGIERAVFAGHSFGGRLVLELAARRPDLVERAILLDPAIQLLPWAALEFAEMSRDEPSFATAEESVDARLADPWPTPRAFVEEDRRDHLVEGRDGRLRFRMCSSAVVSVYGELASAPPRPETLRVRTLLVHAPDFGLVRDEQLEAYGAALGDLFEVVTVPGGHMIFWDAWPETAAALARFLAH